MKTTIVLDIGDINMILLEHVAKKRSLHPRDIAIRWQNDRTEAIIETKEDLQDPEHRVNWTEIASEAQEDNDD